MTDKTCANEDHKIDILTEGRCPWCGEEEEAEDFNDLPEAAGGHAELFARDRIRRQVEQELIDYIDGDPENGPRYGGKVTEDDIEAEVERRIKFLRQPAFEYEQEEETR